VSYIKITDGKGFHITFANGYTVSVQFGPGNYCDNYDYHILTDSVRSGKRGSTTAECAVWGPDKHMIQRWDSNTVSNRSSMAEVLELMNWAAAQPTTPEKKKEKALKEKS
jgi:hypothetical protein